MSDSRRDAFVMVEEFEFADGEFAPLTGDFVEISDDDIDGLVDTEELVNETQIFQQGLQRQPNAYEKRVDFVQIKSDLDELQSEYLDQLVIGFEDVRDRLLKFVERNFDRDISVVGSIEKLRGVNQLKPVFLEMLTACFDRGSASVVTELPREAFHAHKPAFLSRDALKFLRMQSNFFVSGINSKLTEEIHQVLLTAIDKGTPLRETILLLEELFQPYIGNKNIIKDKEQAKPHRLETIVRTNLTNAYNRGRLIAAREAGDFIIGYEYSAILDDRTTEVCRMLDGRVFQRGDFNLERLKPPRHFNCRSILVPLTSDIQVDAATIVTEKLAGQALDSSGVGFCGHDEAKFYGESLDIFFNPASAA